MAGNNSNHKKKMGTDVSVSKGSALGDLGESKQTAAKRKAGKNSGNKNVVTKSTPVKDKSVAKKKRVRIEVAETSNDKFESDDVQTATANIDQGSEFMALHISRQVEKATFPMEEDGNGDSTESETEESENVNHDNMHGDMIDEDLDDEVSFPSSSNNNAVLQEVKDNEDEWLAEEEMKSMMRFANFLEKQGYIMKAGKQCEGTIVKEGIAPKGSKERPLGPLQRLDQKVTAKKGQGKNDINQGSIHSSNSEATVYENAVVLDLSGTERILNDKSVEKRNSSSSEDNMEISDESGDEHIKFQNFVDARLSEYRKGVASQQVLE